MPRNLSLRMLSTIIGRWLFTSTKKKMYKIFLCLVFVYSLLCESIAQNAPAAIVVHPPAYSTAVATQTVRMTCAAYGSPTPSIAWTKANGDLSILLSNSYAYTAYNQTLTVNGTEFAISVLEICGVDATDTDEYSCIASNGVSGTGIANNVANFFLSVSGVVSEPPSIVVHPPGETTVDTDNTVEAVCVAYGNPVPWITWNKAGCTNISCSDSAMVYNEIVTYGDVSFRKSILQLCNVQQKDSSWYSCTAFNGIEGDGLASSNWTWQLIVNPPPPPTTSSSASSVVSTSSSSSVSQSTSTSTQRTSSTSASMSATPTEGSSGRLFSVGEERTYQAVIGIETVIILVLIVILIIVAFIACRAVRTKEKSSMEIPNAPKDPRVFSVENPLHDGDDHPTDVDTMTYADLAKKMEDD